MNDFDEITMFVGRVGFLYAQKNISPPFGIRKFAEAWAQDGISLSHWIKVISRDPTENPSR